MSEKEKQNAQLDARIEALDQREAEIEKIVKSEISDEDKNEIIQGILELILKEEIAAVIDKALKD
ncbi:hypothetical protein [Facklamia hominis]